MGWQIQISAVGAKQTRFNGAPLEVHTWLHTDIGLISPLVDWLMDLIAESGCVREEEQYVELAFREVPSNAMLLGNRLNAPQAGSPPWPLSAQLGSVHRR